VAAAVEPSARLPKTTTRSGSLACRPAFVGWVDPTTIRTPSSWPMASATASPTTWRLARTATRSSEWRRGTGTFGLGWLLGEVCLV